MPNSTIHQGGKKLFVQEKGKTMPDMMSLKLPAVPTGEKDQRYYQGWLVKYREWVPTGKLHFE